MTDDRPDKDIERDRLSNHIADMVRFGLKSTPDGLELSSEFRCLRCGNQVMQQVTLIFQSAVPPGVGVGVKGRIRCGKCGNAARVDIMPEEPGDRSLRS
jgi:hypothetical protein